MSRRELADLNLKGIPLDKMFDLDELIKFFDLSYNSRLEHLTSAFFAEHFDHLSSIFVTPQYPQLSLDLKMV